MRAMKFGRIKKPTQVITDEKIKEMWAKCFERARRQAELDMQKKS
jgi:hypothetical protein